MPASVSMLLYSSGFGNAKLLRVDMPHDAPPVRRVACEAFEILSAMRRQLTERVCVLQVVRAATVH